MNNKTRPYTVARIATVMLLLSVICLLGKTQESRAQQSQKKQHDDCPPHTKMTRPGVCTLRSNALQIQNTMKLRSGTTLDCAGGTISPAGYNSSNPYESFSSPQVGLFLYDVRKVHIKNCRIEGFDFGIFAMNSKVGRGDTTTNNSFTNNIIIAHYTPISLFSVDNTEIANNQLTFTQIGGRGLTVQRDSDRNNIHDNASIKADLAATRAGAYLVPAPRDPNTGGFVSLLSNPLISDTTSAQMVFIGQLPGLGATLLTAVVEGVVYQHTVLSSIQSQDFNEDNIFENNQLFMSNPAVPYDGISVVLARRTKVRNNIVNPNTKVGIRVGSQMDTPRKFPGTCSITQKVKRACNNDPRCKRSCLDDRECNIAGVDTFDTSNPDTLSKCENIPPEQKINWTSVGNDIDRNVVNGPFDVGIVTASDTITIQRNIIRGPSRVPGKGGGILLFGKLALETAIVTRNVVSDVTPALFLQQTFQLTATTFGAKISLNDFTGWNITGVPTRAVQISNGYNLPTELSTSEGGNFWGMPCPPGFDSSIVLTEGFQAPNPLNLVMDRATFERAVALTPDQFRPPPCSQTVRMRPFGPARTDFTRWRLP